jgi:hypothetical protein
MLEAEGQLLYEWSHLMESCGRGARRWPSGTRPSSRPDAHPLFRIVPGPVASWERT